MSSSLIETSPITLLAANCASCFAAVFLTEVDDPVSSKRRSLSNLIINEWNERKFVCDLRHTSKSYRKGITGPS